MSEPAASIEQRISAVLAQETAPQPAQDAPEPAAPVASAAPVEAAEAAPEPVTETQEAEPEVIEIADLDGLAAHLGVDPAELYNVAVPYTKNGERAEFTLGDIKDKFQAFEEANEIREQSSKQLEAYRAAEQRLATMIQEQTAQTAQYVQQVEQMALAPFMNTDWNTLRVQNPGEFINKSQQLQQVQAQLAQMKQRAAESVNGMLEKHKEQQKALMVQREAREQQALLKAIPEWRDPKVADAERLELAEFMLSRGYTVEEIEAVDDHRALLLVRDALRVSKAKDAGSVAAKKVVKLAKKIVKPGSRPSSGDGARTQAAALAKAHQANPGSTDLAAARIALKLGRK